MERDGNKGPQRFLAKEFHDDNDNDSLKQDDNNSLEDEKDDNDDDDDDGSEDGNNIGNVERFETSKRAKCFLSTRVTRI